MIEKYEKMIAQAIVRLDNTTVPIAFMNTIGIPIAQASEILHAIYNDIQKSKKAAEEEKVEEESAEETKSDE